MVGTFIRSTRHLRGLLCLLAILVLTFTTVRAHEGHDHKVMGTVAAIQAGHLEVRDADGKSHHIVLNSETKCLRGTKTIAATEIKVGEKVVVNVGAGKEPLTAKEVRVGTVATTAAPTSKS